MFTSPSSFKKEKIHSCILGSCHFHGIHTGPSYPLFVPRRCVSRRKSRGPVIGNRVKRIDRIERNSKDINRPKVKEETIKKKKPAVWTRKRLKKRKEKKKKTRKSKKRKLFVVAFTHTVASARRKHHPDRRKKST